MPYTVTKNTYRRNVNNAYTLLQLIFYIICFDKTAMNEWAKSTKEVLHVNNLNNISHQTRSNLLQGIKNIVELHILHSVVPLNVITYYLTYWLHDLMVSLMLNIHA